MALDQELNLPLWEQWFFHWCNYIPQGHDSWMCHLHDTLHTYLMGGEL